MADSWPACHLQESIMVMLTLKEAGSGSFTETAWGCRVYDRVSISLHGSAAQTNFPPEQYSGDMQQQFSGMGREELQRALGVKPMDKSSRCLHCSPLNSG